MYSGDHYFWNMLITFAQLFDIMDADNQDRRKQRIELFWMCKL